MVEHYVVRLYDNLLDEGPSSEHSFPTRAEAERFLDTLPEGSVISTETRSFAG